MQTHTNLHLVGGSFRIASAAAAMLMLAASATVSPSIERVVLISVDGLRPDAIEKLGPKGAPTFHRLLREGAGTLDARSEPTFTYTMPNHVCMVTGRPANGSEGHGYLENSFNGWSIHQVKRTYVSSVFDVVHDHGYRAAMVSSKPKFALFRTSYVEQGKEDELPPNHGRRKIDQTTITYFDDRQAIEETLALLRITTPPRFLFLHLAGPDVTGHTYGFEVEEGSDYLDEVRRQDALLGRIMFAVGARRSLTQTTAIILTSDHGGSGKRHGDSKKLENHRVPFLIWGPGVAAGVDLKRLNPSLQPIRNCYAGNLALSMLKLPPIPGSTFRGVQYSGGIEP